MGEGTVPLLGFAFQQLLTLTPNMSSQQSMHPALRGDSASKVSCATKLEVGMLKLGSSWK